MSGSADRPAIMATMHKKDAVELADLEEARDKVLWGRQKKSRVVVEEEKRITAYHEAGHTLVGSMIPECDPVHKVTIIPRGVGALGYVLQRPEDERHMQTQGELESDIKVALGGTMAEELIYGEIANGATLSSRQTVGGDPLTADSVADSGDLTLAAPVITQIFESSRPIYASVEMNTFLTSE